MNFWSNFPRWGFGTWFIYATLLFICIAIFLSSEFIWPFIFFARVFLQQFLSPSSLKVKTCSATLETVLFIDETVRLFFFTLWLSEGWALVFLKPAVIIWRLCSLIVISSICNVSATSSAWQTVTHSVWNIPQRGTMNCVLRNSYFKSYPSVQL